MATSYAEIVLATVPAAPPALKNERATSCPPPISAMVPYVLASRFSASAFCRVPSVALFIMDLLQDSHRHKRLVIASLLEALVCPHGRAKTFDNFRGLFPRALEDAPQPMIPEQIVVLVPRLGHTVGVKQEGVTGFELHRGFFERFGMLNSQRISPHFVQ